jgi:hypothetical protein
LAVRAAIHAATIAVTAIRAGPITWRHQGITADKMHVHCHPSVGPLA